VKDLPIRMIDIFPHIMPLKYKEALLKKARGSFYMQVNEAHPALWDLDTRFRVMDEYEGLVEVITIVSPPLEYVVSAKDAVGLAKIANDEMAELVAKYPERFIAAVACLPMNDIDAALEETDRAIKELHFKGVQIYTPTNGKPLDSPEFMELYRKMEEYDLPIWIHPHRSQEVPDYGDEKESKYGLFSAFGWPYETTLAMARLVLSGVMERYPNIKFITHHCGGMLPSFGQRFAMRSIGSGDELARPPIEYFKKFYADTMLSGNTAALMCGYALFGPDNILFGSDYPLGRKTAEFRFKRVIESINEMDVPQADKEKIFKKNAERILRIADDR